MAFHIPFNQRHHSRQQFRPIYIGFDTPPRRPRRKFNWWGFNGLWLSLASFVTAGVMSPIALIISLVGLRKGPKKMAVAGTVFSLMGIGLITSLIVGAATEEHQRHHIAHLKHQKRVVAAQIVTTQSLIDTASEELDQYSDAHDGMLPSWIDCNMLMIKYEDPWGVSLRFDAEADDWGTLRSAGPDSEFDTKDDLTNRIEGETDRQVLLDLD